MEQMTNEMQGERRCASWYALPAIGAAVPLAFMLIRRFMGKGNDAARERKLLKKSRIDMQDAMDTALSLCPGQPVEIQLEEEQGIPVWDVEILPRKGGPRREVLIDARTGRLLEMKAEFEMSEQAQAA